MGRLPILISKSCCICSWQYYSRNDNGGGHYQETSKLAEDSWGGPVFLAGVELASSIQDRQKLLIQLSSLCDKFYSCQISIYCWASRSLIAPNLALLTFKNYPIVLLLFQTGST